LHKQGGKRYTFRGKTIEDLLKISKGDGDKLVSPELCELFESKMRRRVARGLGHRYNKVLDKIRKSKKACLPGEKPVPVKTHYRSMIVRIIYFLNF
jgi:small subunit ribosomal protein S15e